MSAAWATYEDEVAPPITLPPRSHRYANPEVALHQPPLFVLSVCPEKTVVGETLGSGDTGVGGESRGGQGGSTFGKSTT
jgi:hypothetical protein